MLSSPPPATTARPTARPTATRINAEIRRLIERPADRARAQEYRRLLLLWAEATAESGHWGRAA